MSARFNGKYSLSGGPPRFSSRRLLEAFALRLPSQTKGSYHVEQSEEAGRMDIYAGMALLP